MRKILLCGAVAVCFSSSAFGAATIGTWSNVASTTAVGSIGSTAVTATTNSDAAFQDALEDRFNDTSHCAGWETDFPLPDSALGLTTTNVNAGDSQRFDFSEAYTGWMYIENFDSNSIAKITVEGGGSVDLLVGSSSISYDAISDSMGTLKTSNASFNGEGDFILQLTGPVTAVQLDYSAGDGANGVFYGFAQQMMMPPGGGGGNSVPEPASVLIWGLFAGLLVFKLKRK